MGSNQVTDVNDQTKDMKITGNTNEPMENKPIEDLIVGIYVLSILRLIPKFSP